VALWANDKLLKFGSRKHFGQSRAGKVGICRFVGVDPMFSLEACKNLGKNAKLLNEQFRSLATFNLIMTSADENTKEIL